VYLVVLLCAILGLSPLAAYIKLGARVEFLVTAKRAIPKPEVEASSVVHPPTDAAPSPGPTRVRVADRVFAELLGSILRGELRPGEPVPTQRALSRKFGVSPLVVRQAIHRLEELELVRVRQGSPTIVLDPNQAADVRLIQLQLEAATPGDSLALAGLENRALSALPLLVLAARRISDEELDELDALVEALGTEPSAREFDEFQVRYWSAIARATCNPLLQHQVRWWFHTLPRLAAPTITPVESLQVTIYRDLNTAFRNRSDVLESWLCLLHQLFDWVEAQPGHAVNQSVAPEAVTRFDGTRSRGAARS
jgi:DNA-binding FadR family transcriptional regulator